VVLNRLSTRSPWRFSRAGAADVNNDNQKVTPQYTLNVDRTRAAQLGVTAQSAGTALGAAVDGLKVASFSSPVRATSTSG